MLAQSPKSFSAFPLTGSFARHLVGGALQSLVLQSPSHLCASLQDAVVLIPSCLSCVHVCARGHMMARELVSGVSSPLDPW